jgi:hypothetical protein
MVSQFSWLLQEVETAYHCTRVMCKYDDVTMEPIPPILGPGEKEHVLLPQDECIVSTNDGPHKQ